MIFYTLYVPVNDLCCWWPEIKEKRKRKEERREKREERREEREENRIE